MNVKSSVLSTAAVLSILVCGCAHVPEAFPPYDGCLQLLPATEGEERHDAVSPENQLLPPSEKQPPVVVLDKREPSQEIREAIERLDRLLAAGLITKNEYDEKIRQLKNKEVNKK